MARIAKSLPSPPSADATVVLGPFSSTSRLNAVLISLRGTAADVTFSVSLSQTSSDAGGGVLLGEGLQVWHPTTTGNASEFLELPVRRLMGSFRYVVVTVSAGVVLEGFVWLDITTKD